MQISQVVSQLRKARANQHRECERIDHALSALGHRNSNSNGRILSPDARKRIGDAQRKRWAKTKKSKLAAQPIKQKERKNNYWASMSPTQRRNEMKRRGMLKVLKK